MSRSTNLVGDAGAFLVAAELALRGWPASLTSAGTARTDILAQVGEEQFPVAIQVKTKNLHSKDFQAGGVRDAAASGANEWVVLVALGENRKHRFFVLPRDVLVATVRACELAVGSARFLGEREFSGYEGEAGWTLLERPSWEAPWRLNEWVVSMRDEIEWRIGHSGFPADIELTDAPA